MLHVAGLLSLFMEFGMLATLVGALQFDFTEVRQCEPITISFSGANSIVNQQVTTNLTIIPLNSTLINIPVDPSYVSTGINVNFLPLPAGSQFLAALDDNAGNTFIPVSDLIRVLPSPGISNSTCIAAMNHVVPRRFSLATNVSQCEEMSITYNTSVVPRAPSIRLFNPKGPSVLLNATFDDPSLGKARYLVSFPREKEIVLLMDGGNGIQETSPLITVQGDASSDMSCIRNNLIGDMTNMAVTNDQTNASTPSPSRAILIGCVVGGTILLILALSIVIFVVRDRRKRTSIRLPDSESAQVDKQPQESDNQLNFSLNMTSPSLLSSPVIRETVINPIYTTNAFLSSPRRAKYTSSSTGSWKYRLSGGELHGASLSRPRVGSVEILTPRTTERVSIESLDIEGMLNMLSLQTESVSSRKNSAATVLGSYGPTLTLSAPRIIPVRPKISQRHLRNPSDVPAGPDSMTFSGYSVNPFDGHTSITPSILHDRLVLSRPFKSPLASPVSPNAIVPDNNRINPSISNRSSSDWYGIAR